MAVVVKGERGYTLAELLVAATISIVLLGGIYWTLYVGTNAYRVGADRVASQQDQRAALEQFLRIVRHGARITIAERHMIGVVDPGCMTVAWGSPDVTFEYADGQGQAVPTDDEPLPPPVPGTGEPDWLVCLLQPQWVIDARWDCSRAPALPTVQDRRDRIHLVTIRIGNFTSTAVLRNITVMQCSHAGTSSRP